MLSPLPRRITSGTSAGKRTSAEAASRSTRGTSWMTSGSMPASASAGAMTTSRSRWAEPSAAEPVRSTPALRDFTSWEATSTVTFGRAS